MCGIAGLLRPGGADESGLSGTAARMTAALAHRGPDASGIWTRADAGIAFGQRRLAILDLSEAGAQPMHSACGRYTITFNGEIYNHLDIRAELEVAGAAPNWRGHSDTETLLAAIRQWSVAPALQRLIGMFAFALWDAETRQLILARDRFGEKPLFYGWSGADLVFGSELKALAAHPDWAPSLDRAALTAFMRYSYVPAPATIWSGVRKLPQASFVSFAADAAPGSAPAPQAYWSLRNRVVEAQSHRIGNETEAIARLEQLLSVAVKRQCLSDVPLGAFLSGGVDSSTIVALMQAQTSQPVRTFSIGFSEGGYNEAEDARRVAQHLGTDHTELYVDARTAMDVIPKLPRIYDEPFADSSQIPTHLVAQLARRHVTVALSGDAGDELFGGYNRHVWGGALQARLGRVPMPLRRAVGAVLGVIAPEPADTILKLLQPVLPARLKVRHAGDQVAKLGHILAVDGFDGLYRTLCSIDQDPLRTVIGGEERASWAGGEMQQLRTQLDPLDRMTLADSLSYLSDDILQKVDRAAMAVALETRVPFLDKDVVEFSATVPAHMKVRDGRGKWLVRQVLYRHVPAEMIDRPKTGFSVPLDAWLRGPLKAWAADLLSPARLKRQGLFDSARVSRMFDEHLSRRHNHSYWLWNVLMAQAWHDEWAGAR
ncbi:putative Asparagine synthetase asnB [Bradyrhizobium sp. ORS 285]|uniref:asparagine synthase (glutamine-hydrolyzing) n=1 Tax=Bradyrhizobium sp. ORS 285 TaxID=115808 RepID=UPI000240B105|nr:asparagine synthase (glutamine-hydrolyzing) [Bradyrhizobium sp. ORS 285]CCD83602.1 putative Asparagine synthetase asnB [Bradyrhizobium sp. ORS 285]SMX57219.1 putative Asparagine synthetase asnB [Bradyrhizobium sp. ORS 285]